MITPYYFSYVQPNEDYDDIYKLYIYDSENDNLIGYVSFEIVMNDSGFFDDIQEEFDNYFDSVLSIIYISEVKIIRKYRYKGYGNIMMNEFLSYCMNMIGITDLILIPDSIDNDLGIPQGYYNQQILVKFYKKLGFDNLEDTNYMVQKLI